ncbi:MAG: MFS transporter [Acidobacteriia bacterium]|nr:MFS transporter [Terriglobia bacterium]
MTSPVASSSWRQGFRALHHRDFRIFLIGQMVSLSGSWMQGLAQSWLIYRLTHSTFLMGTLGFCTHIPVLLLSPIGGIAADRFSRRRLVILSQFAFLAQASTLAYLTLTDRITVPYLLALATLFGIVSAFEIPARQSLYVLMVGQRDLSNAIALNSMTFNAARLVGPPIAGFILAAFGEGICFLVNALTFLAVIGSLFLISPSEPSREVTCSALSHIREGFTYAWDNREVRLLLGVTALVNLAGSPVILLGPVFADAIFHQGSQGLGFLTGALGLGAVLGTIILARQTGTSSMARTVLVSALTMSLGLTVFAISPSFPLSLLAVGLVGFSIFRQLAATNTLIQTLIQDDYRGRTMAIYSMMVIGMLPLGNLASGAAAEQIGARATVFCGAILALGAAAVLRIWAGYRFRKPLA